MDRYEAVVERVVATSKLVVLVGGLDAGKSRLSRAIAAAGIAAGRTIAYVDADLAQKSVGPPTCVGLRIPRSEEDLEPDRLRVPEAIYFVGAISPQGQLLPLVVGTARMLAHAREAGADLVIVDTNGLVSGVYGQLLKYHKIEMLQADTVVGLQRGEELDPLFGVVSRFFPSEVVALPVDANLPVASVDERAGRREDALRRYFTEPLQRWRVKPTVFMPALPSMFEASALDRIVVGLSDGQGGYTGLGYLEYAPDEDVLRLISPAGEAPKALKLGSVRLDESFRVRRVDLRNLFGTD